jgi:hypothetical protein
MAVTGEDDLEFMGSAAVSVATVERFLQDKESRS